MKELKLGNLYYEISRHNPPAIYVNPGETISVETQDTFNGLVKKQGDHRNIKKKPYGNPQSGPIYINGADKGDTLAVHIQKIDARIGQAVNEMSWGRNGMAEFLGTDVPRATRICPVKDGKVWWSPRVGLPYSPMIGTIGTAPAIGVPTTGPAGPYGGNMDLKEVSEGNTLYLPISVPGALLHLGDVHAAQGDGEVCGTALEMPATVTIKIDLIKNKTIERPRIKSRDHIMCIATGNPMERSVARAYSDLFIWMEEDFGVDRWDAYSLCTQVGEISVGYFLIGTVATKIRIQYVEQASSL